MRTTYNDGDTFTRDGLTFRVKFRDDNDGGAPWEEHDGHGPVTDWVTRSKKPGELILSADGCARRYYDFAAAVELAKADGWGSAIEVPGETDNEKAARAALQDFKYLQGWALDDWRYLGVIVALLDDDGEEVTDASLWRVESGNADYLAQVVEELTGDIMAGLADTVAKAAEKAAAKVARLQSIIDRLTNGEGAQA